MAAWINMIGDADAGPALREAFDRYDTNGNGEIDRAECAAMSLVLGGCHDAFLEFALDEQLDVHGYGRAPARVAVGSLAGNAA